MKSKIFVATLIVIQCATQPISTVAFAKGKQKSRDTTEKQSSKKPRYKSQAAKTSLFPSNDFFRKSQQEDLLRSTAQLGILIGLTGVTYAILGEPLVLSTLIAPIIGSTCTEPIMNIGSKFSLLFMPEVAKASLKKVMKLQSCYQKKDP